MASEGDVAWYAIRISLMAFDYCWPVSVIARLNRKTVEGVPTDIDVTLFFDTSRTKVCILTCYSL